MPLDLSTPFRTEIESEIGELEAVILHTPGAEVENMTPSTAPKALYSDILNLHIAQKEYQYFEGVLSKVTKTLQVKDLLKDVLSNESCKMDLLQKISKHEIVDKPLFDELMRLEPQTLAISLIEGIELKHNSLTNYLSSNRYQLQPLHNFFYTRDTSVAVGNSVFISRMANKVRDRESLIMDAVFTNHPYFSTQVFNPDTALYDEKIRIEGGDILIARNDILLIGMGPRTSSQGVDFIIERLKQQKTRRHVIVQELPDTPESFIHLDMVFTLLDRNQCMVFAPLIIEHNQYRTIHIEIDNGEIRSIVDVESIPAVLKQLGMDLEVLYCGGKASRVNQEREQWHSGANFFAIGPGKVMGYERNQYTLEELSRNGYEVFSAKQVLRNEVDLTQYKKYVVALGGSELPRGGGGCRCMTLPVKRKKV